MRKIPEPLRIVLKDFCHVEWYEVDELAEAIKSGDLKLDVTVFEKQLNELLLDHSIPVDDINELTGNEFESQSEVKQWLSDIKMQTFSTNGL